MSKRKAPAKRKTIARRGPPRRPLSKPTASVKGPSSGRARVTLERLRLDPVLFADTFLPNNEKGEPWRLSRHQRRVLVHMFKRAYRLRVWGEKKKSGKTFLAAVLLI
jgi:hypothetical protein